MRKHSISQSFWVYRYLFSSQGHENKFVRVLGHEKTYFYITLIIQLVCMNPMLKRRVSRDPYWPIGRPMACFDHSIAPYILSFALKLSLKGY